MKQLRHQIRRVGLFLCVLFALLVLVVNLFTDIIYSFLDPRVEF